MFDQLKAMKALSSLMGNREEITRKIEQMQADLVRRTVEGDAGAGAVRVTANGKLEITRVELDPSMIATLSGPSAAENKAIIEELVASAVNEALRRAQDIAREEMSKAAGGLNLPGLEGLLNG